VTEGISRITLVILSLSFSAALIVALAGKVWSIVVQHSLILSGFNAASTGFNDAER
jgi:hypothetical protein